MVATKIGVTYNQSTGEIRSIIVPDDDLELVSHEDSFFSLLVLDRSEYDVSSAEDIQRIINDAAGIIAPEVVHEGEWPADDVEIEAPV